MSASSLNYGAHLIDEDDIAAVVAALRSERLTQGPRVAAFERGLGRHLMGRLIEIARGRGLKSMNGQILSVNTGMLELAASVGFALADAGGAPGVKEATLDLGRA